MIGNAKEFLFTVRPKMQAQEDVVKDLLPVYLKSLHNRTFGWLTLQQIT